MRFLERVIEEKKEEVAAKRVRRPIAQLERAAGDIPVRDFRRAIAGGGRIIAEVKKKSPRFTRFRQSDNADGLARIYETGGASAISVVTDAPNFGTSLDDARRIKQEVSIPVLVKDFIIDPYQVYEARAFGADAVLLIGRLIEPEALASLLELARRLGMHALVEVHTRADLDGALEEDAGIIGINNRDLDTLEVDLNTTKELLGGIPEGKTVVSESGHSRRGDIESLSALGVDAFLIGGALLESPDPARLLQELLVRDDTGIDPAQNERTRHA